MEFTHNLLNGRSTRIRTLDPLLPKQMRYQAALHSVISFCRRVLVLVAVVATTRVFPSYLTAYKMAILTGLEPAFSDRQSEAFPDGNRTIDWRTTGKSNPDRTD